MKNCDCTPYVQRYNAIIIIIIIILIESRLLTKGNTNKQSLSPYNTLASMQRNINMDAHGDVFPKAY